MVAITWDMRIKLLTIQESARILHVHVNTVRRWCDQGIIPAFRVGPRADRRLLESDVISLKSKIMTNHGDCHGVER